MKRGVWLLSFGLFILLLGTTYFWGRDFYLLVSIVLIFVAMFPFFSSFEKRHVPAEEIVLLANLVAIAAVVRIPFASIPSVQPTSFVIISAGLALGRERGFLVGSLAALVSNIFLGQGPWTPWQMFSWGMMGFSAGWLAESWLFAQRSGRMVFGFLWGLLFGWIMNGWYAVGTGADLTWVAYLVACVASFPMDISHGLANVFFIGLFEKRFLNILKRIKGKYGL